MKVALMVASLATSGLVLLLVTQLSDTLVNVPAVRVAFFALLPTLVAVNVVVERHGWGFCSQVWETLAALGALRRDVTQRKLTPAEALAEARAELFRAFSERWPVAPRSRASLSRPLGLSSRRPGVVSSSTSGSSLYEQVKGELKDHVFPRAHGDADAPVYLMDPVSGCFLKATHQRKLVLTAKPNAACLFHVERGKSHHWGFHAAASQRYIGQNFVGRMIAASKKLHAWESFRVLQRPEDKGVAGGSPQLFLILCSARFGKGMWLARKSGSSNSSGNNSSSQVVTSRSSSTSFENDGDSNSDHDRGNLQFLGSKKRGVFLSKNFDNALGLIYGSDLAALAAQAADICSQNNVQAAGNVLARAHTAPRLTATLPVVQSTAFQAPVLTRWAHGDMRLPWLEVDSQAQTGSRFLELPEKDLTEVLSTTISNCSVQEFLEMVVPRSTRRQCHAEKASFARSAPAAFSAKQNQSSAFLGHKDDRSKAEDDKSEDGLLWEWHSHPRFGFLRALSFRPAGGAGATFGLPGNSRNGPFKSIKSVAIDQYHACSVDEDTEEEDEEQSGHGQRPLRAKVQSKMYTLSIPYSNCFSIETLVEVEDVPGSDVDSRDTTVSSHEPSSAGARTINPQSKFTTSATALRIRCLAGVVFSRSTMFKPQIERGALDGVTSSCSLLVEMLRERKAQQLFIPPRRRGSLSGAQNQRPSSSNVIAFAATGTGESPPDSRTQERLRTAADLAFLPRTFALEVVKGLIHSVCNAQTPAERLSVLPLQLPWKPYSSLTNQSTSHASSRSTPATSSAITAVPFFESAPEAFAQVLEEDLGSQITPSLFFEALLSDACSFFRPAHPDTGNMEVDVGAWRSFVAHPSRRERGLGFLRKQAFCMPLSGVPGADVAQVEDFQYYALVQTRKRASSASTPGPDSEREREAKKQPRLEFGMKIFVPALPEGNQFSIEVLVVVQPSQEVSTNYQLCVFFASPPRHRHPETRAHAIVNPHVVAGVLRGLKQIWRQVAHAMMDACKASHSHRVQFTPLETRGSHHAAPSEEELDLIQRLQADSRLPTHDELASKIIDAIAAAY